MSACSCQPSTTSTGDCGEVAHCGGVAARAAASGGGRRLRAMRAAGTHAQPGSSGGGSLAPTVAAAVA
eukprot:9354755-Alexandrium_andersonii.AAC.1